MSHPQKMNADQAVKEYAKAILNWAPIGLRNDECNRTYEIAKYYIEEDEQEDV